MSRARKRRGPDGVRWRALREAAYELELTAHRVGPVAPTLRGGGSAVPDILERGHTAVLGYNDLVAVGVVKCLLTAGVAVPEAVSVVGFDNTLAADLVIPGLTTVASPGVLMGQTAVSTVLVMRNGAQPRRDEATVLPVRLVVRESTGPVRS